MVVSLTHRVSYEDLRCMCCNLILRSKKGEKDSMLLDQKIVKRKLGLLEVGGELGNVAEVCKTMWYSRDLSCHLKN